MAEKDNLTGSVVVVGAGIAGMQASLDLADSGYYVHLVDRSPTVGGMMAQLDKTFPTNDCTMWVISPKLVEVGRHTNINIIANTEIESVSGEPGNFTVSLANHPRFIDAVKCTGCGQCSEVCPVKGRDEFNCNLSQRAAVYIQYAQSVPLSYAIDPDLCLGCGLCEKVCLAEAIAYGDTARKSEVQAGAVVLALGTTAFDPSGIDAFAYNRSPNIVTSLEFERILSASGPYQGHVQRPLDLKIPRKIAWLQCVGSRDINRSANAYCSSVCCMYAIKQTVIAKEHVGEDLECALFYMDMRTHGKDFERYYDTARDQHQVRFVNSRVHTIEPMPDSGDLSLRYVAEDGGIETETFDMVVLSVGLEVSGEAIALADRLGVDLTDGHFVKTGSFSPVQTSRQGIFVCGTLQGPKDIPQSVIEASAAAAAAGETLSDARNTCTRKQEPVPEIDIAGQSPRIGVFVCKCGINIAGVVDVPAVRDYAATLENVVYVEDNLYTCSQDTQDLMAAVIREKGLNRVVVASCTPKTHEALFQETLINAGLNKYLFEMTNIRNQDSWVHKNNPDLATAKAKDLVRMAVESVTRREPLEEIELTVGQQALVVGGGLAGMTSALSLARQGYRTHLVEKADRLGGQALHLYKTWQGDRIRDRLADMVAAIEAQDNIQVHLNTRLSKVTGFVGNFTSILTAGDLELTVEHGVTIIATGGSEYKPDEYLYGKNSRVLTSLELDERFNRDDPALAALNSAVFIQCVGSREPERPYCSRVCCTHSMESALTLKRRNPDMNVYILYRDIRTYGERETLFQAARAAGVVFVRYRRDARPEVAESGDALTVRVTDHVLGRPLAIDADLLVLATAIVPPRDEQLANFFKVPLNADGFFVERHAKLGPSEFATDGVFLCGLAHYPKPIDEAIVQGQAAASRAVTLLARKTVRTSGEVAHVNPAMCAACGVCVAVCPYSAPSFIEPDARFFPGRAQINPALCKGCGLCAASCRSGAIRLRGFDNDQIFAMIEAL